MLEGLFTPALRPSAMAGRLARASRAFFFSLLLFVCRVGLGGGPGGDERPASGQALSVPEL
eukprot:7594801-Lingulodinium_polyedra.AAC.1